jgi:peptidoglycan/LPS O-acetylase OafA/YrhL
VSAAVFIPDPGVTLSPPVKQTAGAVRKPPLPGLTGLRGPLALGIVLFHFTPPHMRYLDPFIDNSFVFVGFFFLLSGFILSYNYADRAGTLIKRDFWLARFARLYPVYLLALLLSFAMVRAEWHARSHAEFWSGIVLTPLLLQGWSPSLATFWNTVAWTLSAEVVLYAAFPWLLRLPWPKKAGQLIALLLGLWALGLVPHMLYIWINPDHLIGPATRYTSGYWIRVLKYTPLAYACTFLAGFALGKLQSILVLAPRQRTAVALGSLVAIAAFLTFEVTRVPYILMHGGLLMPLFAALIVGLSGPNPVSSVFAWRPAVLLGQSSYCLYLLHFNAINLVREYKLPQRMHLTALDPWISYAAVLAMAIAVFYLVEEPARKAILRKKTLSSKK